MWSERKELEEMGVRLGGVGTETEGPSKGRSCIKHKHPQGSGWGTAFGETEMVQNEVVPGRGGVDGLPQAKCAQVIDRPTGRR